MDIVNDNFDEKIDTFISGYHYDNGDSQTTIIHSLELRLYVHLSRKRKAILQIDKVSSNAIEMNFLFYGSSLDALDWEQVGILEEEWNEKYKKLSHITYEHERVNQEGVFIKTGPFIVEP